MARVARVVPVLALAGLIAAAPWAPAVADSSGESAGNLPQLLSSADRDRYRKIFALQADGRFKPADELIAILKDKILLGHVQAQRYLHPTDYRSSFAELKGWLARYADHPDARRIHDLALSRQPEGAAGPKAPVTSPASKTVPARDAGRSYRSPRERSKAQRDRVAAIKAQIREAVSDDKLKAAKKLLASGETQKLLDPVELDQGHARIAAALFYDGKDKQALALAGEIADRNGQDVPLSHWVAGLASWRLGDFALASDHFRGFAQSPRSSRWSKAAGAYWAGRARGELGESFNRQFWLLRAALHTNTFYGLIARRSLDAELVFDFDAKPLSDGAVELLTESDEGRRALALIEVGERDRAAAELLRVGSWADPERARALVAAAEAAGNPKLSYRLGARLDDFQETFETDGIDGALYPIPPWQPRQGFLVDRALVYAMIRKESRFDPKAVSPYGASGLMQIMPATAGGIDGQDYSGGKARALLDPSLNMDLGQRYIDELLGSKAVDGDLFHMAAAYNGGPGMLARWKKGLEQTDDPLLFIESLPALETRVFIEHVLTNLWIYRARLGQATPSLDQLARGEWPRYAPLDPPSLRLARSGAIANGIGDAADGSN